VQETKETVNPTIPEPLRDEVDVRDEKNVNSEEKATLPSLDSLLGFTPTTFLY
jgi:hypothetical protein